LPSPPWSRSCRAGTGSWPCSRASPSCGSPCATAADPWRGGALLQVSLRRLRLRRDAGIHHLELVRGLFELHAEVEAFAAQQLGDLAQGLLAHVLDLEQILFAVLHQVGQRTDVEFLSELTERTESPTSSMERPNTSRKRPVAAPPFPAGWAA